MATITNISNVTDFSAQTPIVTYSNPVSTVIRQTPQPQVIVKVLNCCCNCHCNPCNNCRQQNPCWNQRNNGCCLQNRRWNNCDYSPCSAENCEQWNDCCQQRQRFNPCDCRCNQRGGSCSQNRRCCNNLAIFCPCFFGCCR